MHQSSTLDSGMDVHNDSSAVADVATEPDAEVIDLGPVGTRPADLDHLVRQRPANAQYLVFVYAAGPCGDWRYRSLVKTGHRGWGVAPAVLPHKAGDRVNPDRRAAVQRARLRRAGARPPVSVPAVQDEAMRDLSRARAEALHDLKTATCRLHAFLLRQASRDTGRAPWGPAHRRWLSEGVCPTPAPPIVFHESVRAVTEHTERLQRRDQALHEPGTAWRLCPGVDARHALRGVPWTVAVTTGAALGDLTRFENPRPRMTSLGLTPSAYASGERRRQGGLTKTGKAHARRALTDISVINRRLLLAPPLPIISKVTNR